MTVYILEDDPGVLDSLVLLIEQLGHDVSAFPDAESFFLKAVPKNSDTVIVDLGLPGIPGDRVMRWVSELSTNPKVVAISGQARHLIDFQLRGIKKPIVVRKPLSEAELAPLLKN
ncbi:MAG: response regulator [Stappiaceae bacterium]